MPVIPEYEIYAMKCAERRADLSTFMLGVEAGRETITIDYFVWLLQGGVKRSSSTPALRRRLPRRATASISPARPTSFASWGSIPSTSKKCSSRICIGITSAPSTPFEASPPGQISGSPAMTRQCCSDSQRTVQTSRT
jgi:hypothetical protein